MYLPGVQTNGREGRQGYDEAAIVGKRESAEVMSPEEGTGH